MRTTVKPLAILQAEERLRRHERMLGQQVRAGQRLGTVHEGPLDSHESRKSISDVLGLSPRATYAQKYMLAFADADQAAFEVAISACISRKNLARVALYRELTGKREALVTDRAALHYGARRIDPVRVLREATITMRGVLAGLEAIHGIAIPDDALSWLSGAEGTAHAVYAEVKSIREGRHASK